MSEIGIIKRAKELGKKGYGKYIWAPCAKCGKERWALVVKGIPRRSSCQSHFGRKGTKNNNWKGGNTKSRGYIDIWLDKGDFFYSAEGLTIKARP